MKTTAYYKNFHEKPYSRYNDPGRFDVCRGCPLKLAMKNLQKKQINEKLDF